LKSLILLCVFLALALPAPGKKKPKPPPTPTQPDILRGCVGVRGITFQPATFWHPVAVEVSGSIINGCIREALITIDVAFFDANGTGIGSEQTEQLVPPSGESEFHVRARLPDDGLAAGHQATRYRNGRVTDVYVRLQP
jgi:hypothetical protein